MTTPATDPAPIACTLTVEDFRDRLAWLADLNRRWLRARRRSSLRLELTYAPQAAAEVREMVRREQVCCAFLSFALHEDADAVRLIINAPEEVRPAADLVFAPFQAVTPTGSACRRGSAGA